MPNINREQCRQQRADKQIQEMKWRRRRNVWIPKLLSYRWWDMCSLTYYRYMTVNESIRPRTLRYKFAARFKADIVRPHPVAHGVKPFLKYVLKYFLNCPTYWSFVEGTRGAASFVITRGRWIISSAGILSGCRRPDGIFSCNLPAYLYVSMNCISFQMKLQTED